MVSIIIYVQIESATKIFNNIYIYITVHSSIKTFLVYVLLNGIELYFLNIAMFLQPYLNSSFKHLLFTYCTNSAKYSCINITISLFLSFTLSYVFVWNYIFIQETHLNENYSLHIYVYAYTVIIHIYLTYYSCTILSSIYAYSKEYKN